MPEGAKTCGQCLRVMSKVKASYNDVDYCVICYNRVFKTVNCDDCGAHTRTPGGRKPALCRFCRLAKRKCIRCKRPVPRAGKVVKEGAICPSCVPQFREKKPCSNCGRRSQYLSRDRKQGFDEPVCERCRRSDHVTCAECGKSRRAIGLNSDSEKICKSCADRRGAPFICPTCGKLGRQHSKSKCTRCYWLGLLGKRLFAAEDGFEQQWAYDLFVAFFDYAAARKIYNVKRYTGRFDVYCELFQRIDAHCNSADDVTFDSLTEACGDLQFWRYDAFVNFLKSQGVLDRHTGFEWTSAVDRLKTQRRLRSIEGVCYAPLVGRYHDYLRSVQLLNKGKGLVGSKTKPADKSVYSFVSAAIRWLGFVDPTDANALSALNQNDLDRFLAHRPGYRNSLRSFVRYLRRYEKLFAKLKLDNPKNKQFAKHYIGHRRSQELIKGWLAAHGEATRGPLVGVLALLYAQPVRRIVALRMVDIERSPQGKYTLAFDGYELELDVATSALVERYLKHRVPNSDREKAWENPYVFPGRIIGTHITVESLKNYFKNFGVNSTQLYSSALINAYLSGLKYPMAAVEGLGVTLPTAMDYARVVDERVAAELRQVIEKSL